MRSLVLSSTHSASTITLRSEMAWKSGVLVVRTTTTVLQLYVLTYVCEYSAVVDDVLIILNAHNRIYFWQH